LSFNSKLRKLFWEMDGLSWALLLGAVVFFTAFMIIPIASILYNAFIFEGEPSLKIFDLILSDSYYFPLSAHITSSFPFLSLDFRISGTLYTFQGTDRLIFSGYDLGVILNSLQIALVTSLLATLLGTALAFIFARFSFPGKSVLNLLVLLPLLFTPFVGAIGLKRMIQVDGVLNILLSDYLHILPFRIGVEGILAVIVVQVLAFYPIAFLNSFNSIVNIDPALEEQAENLGAKGMTLLRKVILPLALPGIEAGAILTFILSLEDLGTPLVFQGTAAEKTLTYQIYSKMFSPIGDIRPEATVLALFLLTFSLIAFFLVRRYVSLRKYAMVSRGGTWKPRSQKAKGWKLVVIYSFVLLTLAFAMLPHVGVALLAVGEIWGSTLLPSKISLRNFSVAFSDPGVISALINSLVYSGIATIIIVVLGTGAAYIVSRKHIPGKELFDTLVTMPMAVPGVVIAAGLFFTYLDNPLLSPLINPAPLLIFSFALRRFPFTVRSSFAGLEQTHVSMEEAAINLGASRIRNFVSIVLGLIYLSVLSGAMLSFIYCMSEVSTSLVIGSANPKYGPLTLKMLDVLYMLTGGPGVAAALGLLLMLMQGIVMGLSSILSKQRSVALVGV